MRLSDFDFDLPDELLAKYPSEKRDASRLMVVHRQSKKIEHRHFIDLPQFFEAGDALVLNNTRVMPARMQVRKNQMDGALIELLLVEEISTQPIVWNVMLDPMKKLKIGHELIFGNNLFRATIIADSGERERHIQFDFSGTAEELKKQLYAIGDMPLPPYIKRAREKSDYDRYQTVYASQPGAVAAPTAGLHFTPEMIQKLKAADIRFPEITLQIGMGTFAPIHREDFQNHQMHSEFFNIPESTSHEIQACRTAGKKLCAVGTTVLRTLESAINENGDIKPQQEVTDLFIFPPYRVKSIDCLLTNFHTPRSSLLMLVSAFGGYDLMMRAYREAIQQKYRFFSYGDAMLIL